MQFLRVTPQPRWVRHLSQRFLSPHFTLFLHFLCAYYAHIGLINRI
nr:MAG TPA: hypothetical protein [Caudoviricetes sp.]